MQHREFEPPEELRDTIKCFWHDSRDFEEFPSGLEVVPDGFAEIIFHFGSGCSISFNGNLQSLPSPFLMGLLNGPALIYARGHMDIIGVRCFPWTVFNLLGLPSGNESIRSFEHPVAALHPALDAFVKGGTIEKAIVLLQQYFLEAQSKNISQSRLFKAGAAMRKANGSMRVNQVADIAHSTVRTLERNFKHSSGFTVKDVSGLIRFEHVRNRLWTDPHTNLAGLAHELGYTDQAHLTREFKRYSGTTPAAFAKKAKKRVINIDFVAFIKADEPQLKH